MFSFLKLKRRSSLDGQVSDAGDDRDLVGMFNEARTPEEERLVTDMARRRRSRK